MDNLKTFEIDQRYDKEHCRYYLNGFSTVMHSHHFISLYTQLADDAVDFQGVYHLKRAAEETFYEVMADYFNTHKIDTLAEKVSVVEDYWQTVGMGKIEVKSVGRYSVTMEMSSSHIDDGWMEKWGTTNKPINFISQGFASAVAALFLNRPPRSFSVREIESLACGDDVTRLKAIAE
jgi:hypothetical protein